jgi:hypothetical protein
MVAPIIAGAAKMLMGGMGKTGGMAKIMQNPIVQQATEQAQSMAARSPMMSGGQGGGMPGMQNPLMGQGGGSMFQSAMASAGKFAE